MKLQRLLLQGVSSEEQLSLSLSEFHKSTSDIAVLKTKLQSTCVWGRSEALPLERSKLGSPSPTFTSAWGAQPVGNSASWGAFCTPVPLTWSDFQIICCQRAL